MHGREGIARKMVEPIPEAELIEGVRRGDPAAFEALVGRYLRRAHALALRLLGHPEDAEDLVQEVFMTVLEKIDTFEPGRPFGPWFFQILRNRGANLRAYRARRATLPLTDELRSARSSPVDDLLRSELRTQLESALEELPERQRLIVRLFEVDGFSGAEIAEALGMKPATVRWNLHQARKRLRASLTRIRGEEPPR